MGQAAYQDSEYCPNCGHLAVTLLEITGWCPQCTLIHYPDKVICQTCGDLFPKKHHRYKCSKCRREEWLRKHADRLEGYLYMGYSLRAACAAVRDDIRPLCQSCGAGLHGGKPGLFCTKKAKCRKAANTYSTMLSSGLSPDAALAIATGRVAILST